MSFISLKWNLRVMHSLIIYIYIYIFAESLIIYLYFNNCEIFYIWKENNKKRRRESCTCIGMVEIKDRNLDRYMNHVASFITI